MIHALRWTALALAGLVGALAPTAGAHAGGFELVSSTIDGGGGTSTGGDFSLTGTIGQPDAGASTGGSFSMEGGFWAAPAIPPCPEDLDGSGAADFGDILAILAAWGNAGGPEDLDGSGTVDFGDILVVLAVWGPCP